MNTSVKIDLVSLDPSTSECALYLVEDGPWPSTDISWRDCLRRIQVRIFDVIDVIIDGALAQKYPESAGKPIRIQIDSPHGLPNAVSELIGSVNDYVQSAGNEYSDSVASSEFTTGIRVVTGHELGRFTKARDEPT